MQHPSHLIPKTFYVRWQITPVVLQHVKRAKNERINIYLSN